MNRNMININPKNIKLKNGSITERNWVLKDQPENGSQDAKFGSLSSRYRFDQISKDPMGTQSRRSHISNIPLERDRDFVVHTPDRDHEQEHIEMEIDVLNGAFDMSEASVHTPGTDGGDMTETDNTVDLDDFMPTDHQQERETSTTYGDQRFISTLSTHIVTKSKRADVTHSSTTELHLPSQLRLRDENGDVSAIFEKRDSTYFDNTGGNSNSNPTHSDYHRAPTPPLPLSDRPLPPAPLHSSVDSNHNHTQHGFVNDAYNCEVCGRSFRDPQTVWYHSMSRQMSKIKCPVCGQCDVTERASSRALEPRNIHPMTRLNPLYRSDTATRKDSLKSAPPDLDDGSQVSTVYNLSNGSEYEEPPYIMSNGHHAYNQQGNGHAKGQGLPRHYAPSLNGRAGGRNEQDTGARPPPISPRLDSLHDNNLRNGNGLHAHFELDRLSNAHGEPIQNLAHNRKFCAAVLFVIFFAALIGVGIGLTIYLD